MRLDTIAAVRLACQTRDADVTETPQRNMNGEGLTNYASRSFSTAKRMSSAVVESCNFSKILER